MCFTAHCGRLLQILTFLIVSPVLFLVWAVFQFFYYRDLNYNYDVFVARTDQTKQSFSQAVPTMIILVACLVAIPLNVIYTCVTTCKCSQGGSCDKRCNTLVTAIHILVGLCAFAQTLIFTWFSVIAFVDIFPENATCACDRGFGPWMSCSCFLPEEGRVQPILTPNVGSNTTGLQQQLEEVLSVSNVTLMKTGQRDVMRSLDLDNIWENRSIYNVFMYSFGIQLYFAYLVISRTHQFYKKSTTGVRALEASAEVIGICILAIDTYSLIYEFLDNAAFFASNKQQVRFLLGIVFLIFTLEFMVVAASFLDPKKLWSHWRVGVKISSLVIVIAQLVFRVCFTAVILGQYAPSNFVFTAIEVFILANMIMGLKMRNDSGVEGQEGWDTEEGSSK